MLIAVGMFCFAETKLKHDILSSVIVRIKAEYVQAFRWKRVRSRNARVGVHCHRHDDVSLGASWKNVHIADVQRGIFLSFFRVEMVRHLIAFGKFKCCCRGERTEEPWRLPRPFSNATFFGKLKVFVIALGCASQGQPWAKLSWPVGPKTGAQGLGKCRNSRW